MDDGDDYSDKLWLTQVSKNDVPTFKIVDTSNSEHEDLSVDDGKID